MPARNSRKPRRAENTTFHVYNRGKNRKRIFVDDADRREFLLCFRRYLAPGEFKDASGRRFTKLISRVEILATCLMPNHFHFVIHQRDSRALEELMHRALTSYVKYFNARHGVVGAMFECEYKAVPKTDIRQIQDAIAYVHNNHPEGPSYNFCSHSAYVGDVERPDWIAVESALGVFGGRDRYKQFLQRYENDR